MTDRDADARSRPDDLAVENLALAAKSAASIGGTVLVESLRGDERYPLDPRLRVRGVESLRVIDASAMPRISSGNTNAPTIMIAEKGAEMVLADARQAVAA